MGGEGEQKGEGEWVDVVPVLMIFHGVASSKMLDVECPKRPPFNILGIIVIDVQGN